MSCILLSATEKIEALTEENRALRRRVDQLEREADWLDNPLYITWVFIIGTAGVIGGAALAIVCG